MTRCLQRAQHTNDIPLQQRRKASGAILSEGLKLGANREQAAIGYVADRSVRRQIDRFCPVSDTKVYLAVEFPRKYALPYWLTAIVTEALVTTPPSESCKDTASPAGVPAGIATLI